jgi:molybdenum-dependent DNA-binding transcriptional regulator ModE
MDSLHWQLSILAKAIHYKNLSGAAAHIGLSQPQLSRIISKLEGEMNVVLLDRTVRRKSGWTPVARKIAETYSRSSRKLTQTLSQLASDDQVSQLTVGTLEGLTDLASRVCRQLFEQTKVHIIEVDVFDLSELEERFERDELDLIFTAREPGRQKHKNARILGYQTFEKREGNVELKALSPFEFSSQAGVRRAARTSRILLSNSLALRRIWVEEFGASGRFPSDVRRKKTGDESEVPVYLIGSDVLNPAIWQKIESLRL